MNFQERYIFNPQTDLIGTGGFARVFKANDKLLNRQVALKFYKGEEGSGYDVMSEIRYVIGKSLNHPNLVAYYDAALVPTTDNWGQTSTLQVGIIEYINGRDYLTSGVDLSAFLKDMQPDPITLQKIIRDVLSGLLYLEQRGVIHRDLKPANILMHRQDNGQWCAKIGDFGLSKNTNSQSSVVGIKGTIEYMSPEQFFPDKYGLQGKIGTNSDLWAFGAILYEIFTQQVPYGRRSNGSSLEQIVNSAINFDTNNLSLHKIPQPYQTIISLCLVQNAAKRVQSAQTLLDILDGKQIFKPTQPDPTPVYNPPIAITPQRDTPKRPTIERQNPTQKPSSNTGVWLGLLAAVIVIGGYMYSNSGSSNDNNDPTPAAPAPATVADTAAEAPETNPTDENYAENIKTALTNYYDANNRHDTEMALNCMSDRIEQYYSYSYPSKEKIKKDMLAYVCFPTSKSTLYPQTIQTGVTANGYLVTYTVDSNCNPNGESGAKYGNRNIRVYIESKLDRNYKITSIRETNREAEEITVSSNEPTVGAATDRQIAASSIQFTETEYDFGAMSQGDKVKHNFTFRNNSHQPVSIVSKDTSNPCVDASYPTTAIRPREIATVIVYFNSRKCTGKQTQTITITDTDANPILLTIKATVY